METTFAKAEHGLMKANLFRPMPRVARPGLCQPDDPALQEEFVFDKRRLSVTVPSILGANDLSLLLTVLALAARYGKVINAEGADTRVRDYIVEKLETTGEFVTADHLMMSTTRSTLCRETGLKANGTAYKRIGNSLERLRSVTYADLGASDEDGPTGWGAPSGQRLLWSCMDTVSKKIRIILNARFTQGMKSGFARIDLNESRVLGEMSRLLHFRWCWMVRAGESGKMETDLLCELIYGDAAEGRKLRGRREEIRRGMRALGELPGWTVTEIALVRFMVTRPPVNLRHGVRRGAGT